VWWFWVRIQLCELLTLWALGNPNRNRNPFLLESNRRIYFQFLTFLIVILWGHLDSIATPHSVSVGFTPRARWKVEPRRWTFLGMAKFQIEVFEMKKIYQEWAFDIRQRISEEIIEIFYCLRIFVCSETYMQGHVFDFKMLHRRCVWLYRNEHSQSNTQILMNHGYMFRLP